MGTTSVNLQMIVALIALYMLIHFPLQRHTKKNINLAAANRLVSLGS
jgi:hypothetical protein